MNVNQLHDAQDNGQDIVELGIAAPQTVLHRLAATRRAKGLSRYEIARLLATTIETIRLQEEAADLSISTLNAWAAALDVPVTELVVEPKEWLQDTQLARPQAERLLRLAAKLRDRSRRRSIQRLAQTFVDQLTEIQPELQPGGNGNGNGNGNGRRNRQFAPRPKINGKHSNGKHPEPPAPGPS
jgi:transcriptional regulator with XRE-family HTH domain